MHILGKWFLQPGDIPADVVFEIDLYAGGEGQWQGTSVTWQFDGETLSIRMPDDSRPLAEFDAEAKSEMLHGRILTWYEKDRYIPDDALPLVMAGMELPKQPAFGWRPGAAYLNDDEEEPDHHQDAAVLMRDAGELRVAAAHT